MIRLLNFYYRTKYISKEIFLIFKDSFSELLNELGILRFTFYILIRILFICFCFVFSLFISYILIKREIVSAEGSEQHIVDFFDRSISNFVNYLNEAESKKELARLDQLKKEEEEKTKIANALLLEKEIDKVKEDESKRSANKVLFAVGFVAGCVVVAVIYVLSRS